MLMSPLTHCYSSLKGATPGPAHTEGTKTKRQIEWLLWDSAEWQRQILMPGSLLQSGALIKFPKSEHYPPLGTCCFQPKVDLFAFTSAGLMMILNVLFNFGQVVGFGFNQLENCF